MTKEENIDKITENHGKNRLTRVGAYNIIDKCDSVYKCRAIAPARHFMNMKKYNPLFPGLVSVAGHPHEQLQGQHRQSKDESLLWR